MVLLPNGNITIYRRYLDENKLDKYERINIDNVNINSKRNSAVTDKGINIFYTTMIMAEYGNYEFSTMDKVVLEHIEKDILKGSELNEFNPLTVVGIQKNNLFNTLNIECK